MTILKKFDTKSRTNMLSKGLFTWRMMTSSFTEKLRASMNEAALKKANRGSLVSTNIRMVLKSPRDSDL